MATRLPNWSEPKPEATIDQYRPIHNYVIVEKTELKPSEKITEGGIVLPEVVQHDHPHIIGRVLKIGPGKLLKSGTRIGPDFKIGDLVVINPYEGRVPNPRRSLYELILPADAVLAVLEEQDE